MSFCNAPESHRRHRVRTMRKDRYKGIGHVDAAIMAAQAELEKCVVCGRKRWVHYLPLTRRREIYPKMDGHRFIGRHPVVSRTNGKIPSRAKA